MRACWQGHQWSLLNLTNAACKPVLLSLDAAKMTVCDPEIQDAESATTADLSSASVGSSYAQKTPCLVLAMTMVDSIQVMKTESSILMAGGQQKGPWAASLDAAGSGSGVSASLFARQPGC